MSVKNANARRGFPTALWRAALYTVGYLFQPGDLLANEKVEGHFGHEEAGPRSVGVVDRRSDVLVSEALERIDGGQAVREDLVEDVAVVGSQQSHKERRNKASRRETETT